jgi:hypothetical protein
VVEERTDDEILLDYLIYAPLGAAIVAVEQAPRIAERLRSRIEVARVVGRFAVREAWRRMAPPVASSASERSRAETDSPRPGTLQAGSPASPLGRGFPVPDYDTLSASAAIAALAGLSAEDLETVRRHELAGRGRRTVLHRITQLSAMPTGAGSTTGVERATSRESKGRTARPR